MTECKVSFELVLPKACHGVDKKEVKQTIRYLLQRDLCALMTGDDVKCKVRFLKVIEK